MEMISPCEPVPEVPSDEKEVFHPTNLLTGIKVKESPIEEMALQTHMPMPGCQRPVSNLEAAILTAQT